MTKIMVLLVSVMATTLALLQAGPAAAAGIPEVVEGKALIAFYREQRMAGAAIQFRVNENGQPIGSLTNGSVLLRDLEPGNYTFSSQVVTGDSLSLTIEAGKTYFVEGTVRMGYFAGRPKFTVVDEARGRNAIAKIN